jgi:hypothetical protein
LDDLKEWRGLQTFTPSPSKPKYPWGRTWKLAVTGSRKLGQFFGPSWVRKAGNETSAKQRKQEDNASQAKDSFDLHKSIDRCGTERDRKGRS